MPPLPDVAQVLRVELKQTYQSDLDVLTRLYFQYSGAAPSDADLTTFAGDVAAAWGSDIAPELVHESVTLTEVTVTDLTSPTSGQGSWAGSSAGGLSGDPLAAGTAFLVNFQIARRYRGGKPRVYPAWGAAASLGDASGWGGGFMTEVGIKWPAFVAEIIADAPGSSGPIVQVNVSYYQGFAVEINPITGRSRNISKPRAVPVVDPVLSTTYSTKPASQRRRNLQKR
jgi:hypothetical protein